MVDSRVSMHMLSKRDLSSEELDTLPRSRNTTVVVTAKGEVQTNEGGSARTCSRSKSFRDCAITRRYAWDRNQESKKERKPTLRGKWESVFSGRHMDSVPKEAHAVSVMTKQPLATVAVVRDEKDHRLLPHQFRRQRLTVKKATETKAPTKEVDKKCTMKHETKE